MENILGTILRWRYLVLILQLALIAGCAFFAVRLAGRTTSAAAVMVQRAPRTVPEQQPRATPPLMLTTLPGGTTGPRAALPFPLNSALIRRLNRDDFNWYSAQWNALNVLMDGIRNYLERYVMPALTHRNQQEP